MPRSGALPALVGVVQVGVGWCLREHSLIQGAARDLRRPHSGRRVRADPGRVLDSPAGACLHADGPGRLPGKRHVVYALLTALALLAGGLLIAAVAATNQTAQAIGLFAFFPLMFFAGLWLPIPSMPPVLQHISHVTPLGAAVQALQYASDGQWPHPQQLLILLAYTVVLGAAAVKLFRWE